MDIPQHDADDEVNALIDELLNEADGLEEVPPSGGDGEPSATSSGDEEAPSRSWEFFRDLDDPAPEGGAAQEQAAPEEEATSEAPMPGAVAQPKPLTKRAVRNGRLLSSAFFAVWVTVVVDHRGLFNDLEYYSHRVTLAMLNRGWASVPANRVTSFSPLVHSTSDLASLHWHHLANGSWVPTSGLAYPYLLLPFVRLHAANLVVFIAAAVACAALTIAMESWVGPQGGTRAVGLFLFSATVVQFARFPYDHLFVTCAIVTTAVALGVWTTIAVWASDTLRWLSALTGASLLMAATSLDLVVAVFVILGCAAIAVAFAARILNGWFAATWFTASVAMALLLHGASATHHHAFFQGWDWNGAINPIAYDRIFATSTTMAFSATPVIVALVGVLVAMRRGWFTEPDQRLALVLSTGTLCAAAIALASFEYTFLGTDWLAAATVASGIAVGIASMLASFISLRTRGGWRRWLNWVLIAGVAAAVLHQ